jgi:Transposase and inactivated derivatives
MLTTKIIKKEMYPYLKFGNNKNNTKVKLHHVVKAILYRLKTGCQWRELPMKEFFRVSYNWQSVYHHFRKWSQDGSWEKMWRALLDKYRYLLDMSCIQIDGTHTPAKRGGESVKYQGRKKSKTSNMLIIVDNQGCPIACSEPLSGNHHDSFNLGENFEKMLLQFEVSKIATEGLFLNADSGFDSADFRVFCHQHEIFDNIDTNKRNGYDENHSWSFFDELLYKQRFVIERTNAWIDAFKTLLVRFETKNIHWKSLNIIAFIAILLRKL